jgi:hypothetical protein
LDFIRQEQVKSTVVKGRDINGRPFFVLRTVATDNEGNKIHFQRYSDNLNLWQVCGHYGNELVRTEGGMNEKQIF